MASWRRGVGCLGGPLPEQAAALADFPRIPLAVAARKPVEPGDVSALAEYINAVVQKGYQAEESLREATEALGVAAGADPGGRPRVGVTGGASPVGRHLWVGRFAR